MKINPFANRNIQFRHRFLIVLIISAVIHFLFILFVIVSPSLSHRSPSRQMIHNVNLVSLPLELNKRLPSMSSQPLQPPKPAEKKKRAIPQPKKEATPKPVEPKQENLTTIKKSETKDQETFSMGNSQSGVQRTGSMTLDASYFPYVYYLQSVRDKIARNWFPPFGVVTRGESKSLMVYFKIEKQGSIFDADVETSSGDSLLDQSALRAVLVSNPFPPLPFGYTDQALGIHFRFECSR